MTCSGICSPTCTPGAKADVAGRRASPLAGLCGYLKKECRGLLESLTGDPSPYVRSLSPDRFIPRDWSWEEARRDAQAVYENYYPLPAAS